jgi:predicted RNA polymerase sigma factor
VTAPTGGIEDLLRELGPQVLSTLVRRYGDFPDAEDAVQEALLAASQQWAADGVPNHPRGWLTTVAARRLADIWRADTARHRREIVAAAQEPTVPPAVSNADDSLQLLFLCCHPSLAPASRSR